jgi:hypothetical protein
MYIDTETLITLVYFIVNNWYLTEGCKYLKGKPGRKPEFTDSEMITFMILKEFLQFKAERKFLGFMHGNYWDMFPDIVDQGQYNRRSRALHLILNKRPKHVTEFIMLSHYYSVVTFHLPFSFTRYASSSSVSPSASHSLRRNSA